MFLYDNLCCRKPRQIDFCTVTELLPSQPLDVQVIPLTDTSFGVEWKSPYNIPHNLTEYTVNVTMLKSFDSASVTDIASEEQNNSQAIVTPHSVQVNVKVGTK